MTNFLKSAAILSMLATPITANAEMTTITVYDTNSTSWYDMDRSCDGGEGESTIGKGSFTLYESYYERVSPLMDAGNGDRIAAYRANHEGEDGGIVPVVLRQVERGNPKSDWVFLFPETKDTVVLFYCGERK